jgi:hypothetical protein
VRAYVTQLRAERVPLPDVLLAVKRLTRGAVESPAGGLPPCEATALTVQVLDWALDAYFAV